MLRNGKASSITAATSHFTLLRHRGSLSNHTNYLGCLQMKWMSLRPACCCVSVSGRLLPLQRRRAPCRQVAVITFTRHLRRRKKKAAPLMRLHSARSRSRDSAGQMRLHGVRTITWSGAFSRSGDRSLFHFRYHSMLIKCQWFRDGTPSYGFFCTLNKLFLNMEKGTFADYGTSTADMTQFLVAV